MKQVTPSLLSSSIFKLAFFVLVSGCTSGADRNSIVITRFRHPGEMALKNGTSDAVRVTQVRIDVSAIDGINGVIHSGATAAADEVVEVQLGEPLPPEWRAVQSVDLLGLARALNEGQLPAECVRAQAFDVSHPELLEHKQGSELMESTLPAIAEIEISRGRFRDLQRITIELEGILLVSDRRCVSDYPQVWRDLIVLVE